VDVAAFCDSCGAVFKSGKVLEIGTEEQFVGNSAGPCPVCIRMGHIPGGVLSFLGSTIEILSALGQSC